MVVPVVPRPRLFQVVLLIVSLWSVVGRSDGCAVELPEQMTKAITLSRSSHEAERVKGRKELEGFVKKDQPYVLQALLAIEQSLREEPPTPERDKQLTKIAERLAQSQNEAWTVRARILSTRLLLGQDTQPTARERLDAMLGQAANIESSVDVAVALAEVIITSGVERNEAARALDFAITYLSDKDRARYYLGLYEKSDLVNRRKALRDPPAQRDLPPLDLEKLVWQSEALRREGKYAQAQKGFEQIIAAKEPSAVTLLLARIGRERCRSETGFLKEAHAALETIIRENGSQARIAHAWLGLAEMALWQAWNPKESQAALTKVETGELAKEEAKRVQADALMLRAICAITRKDLAQASEALRSLIILIPTVDWLGRSVPNLASRLLDTCQEGRHLVRWAEVVLMGDERCCTLLTIAACFNESGEGVRARALFQRALNAEDLPLKPVHRAYAAYEIAYAYRMEDRGDDALVMLDKALLLYPTPPLASGFLIDKARIYLARGDREPGLEALRQVDQRWPTHPDAVIALYNLGMAHYFFDQDDAAMAVFHRLVSRFPDSWEAKRVQRAEILTIQERAAARKKQPPTTQEAP